MKNAQKYQKVHSTGNVSEKVNGATGQRAECRGGNGFEDSGPKRRLGARDLLREARRSGGHRPPLQVFTKRTQPVAPSRQTRSGESDSIRPLKCFYETNPLRPARQFKVPGSKSRVSAFTSLRLYLPQELPNEANAPIAPVQSSEFKVQSSLELRNEPIPASHLSQISHSRPQTTGDFTKRTHSLRSPGIPVDFYETNPFHPYPVLIPIQRREACGERGGKLPNEPNRTAVGKKRQVLDG